MIITLPEHAVVPAPQLLPLGTMVAVEVPVNPSLAAALTVHVSLTVTLTDGAGTGRTMTAGVLALATNVPAGAIVVGRNERVRDGKIESKNDPVRLITTGVAGVPAVDAKLKE